MKSQIFIEKNNTSRKFNGLKNQNEENELFISKKLLIPENSEMKDSQNKFIIKKECNTKNYDIFISNKGRWSKEEHEKFLEGIALYGINWKKINPLIKTRTSQQVRSHAQKFYQKMKLCKDEILGIDFTLNSVCNIRDMINQIKNNNINYNIINIFKYLADKYDNHENPRKYNNTLKKSELINQFNIINLKEDNSKINDNNFLLNHNNNFNKIKKMKETKNINDNEFNDIIKIANQNNVFNILQNLLIMNYNSIVFNSLYPNNLYLSNYDIINSVNKLLINYFISNSELNISNIIKENALLLLVLQNNILNNNINFIHNINLEDINCNNNNFNSIKNINNGDNINKVKDNVENSLFINIGKEYNIDLRHNNNNCNIGDKNNKNDNININKKEVFFPNKQLNKINDKTKNNNDENSNNNNNIFN